MERLWQMIYGSRFLLAFIFIQIVLIYIYISNNEYPKTAYLNTSQYVVASVSEKKRDVIDYIDLKEVNEKLAAENALLKSLTFNTNPQYTDGWIYDTLVNLQYEFQSAKVINQSYTKKVNWLTLNKGEVHGVYKGMGVVSESCIVGVVVDVSKHYALIRSILDYSDQPFAPFVKISRTNHDGPLKWENIFDRVHIGIEAIPRHVYLNVGDSVVSYGNLGMFPENYPIGTIESVKVEPGNDFQNVNVKLNQDFATLEYVYLVKNKLIEEKSNLEAQIKDGE